MRFEDYLSAETLDTIKDASECRKRQYCRKLSKEERRVRKSKWMLIASIILWAIVVIAIVTVKI